MDQTFLQKAEALLIKHEGHRLRPYRCTSGKLTIGVGRNFEDCGITEQEAKEVLQNDILRCELELINTFLISTKTSQRTANWCFWTCVSILGLKVFYSLKPLLALSNLESAKKQQTKCLKPNGRSRLV